jgi:hypothetical protein
MNDRQILQVHVGKHFRLPRLRRGVKSIVFDLDETIGSFSDLHILWTGIENIHASSDKNQQIVFNAVLDLYPEFLRYGIISIFDYLMEKKKQATYDKMYLYTNNQCPPPWISLLCNYIQSKLKTEGELFDKIISAFKMNKKPLEIPRTTAQKTHSDFIRCSLLPATTEICFIDDSYHTNMINDRVYYIQPAPYHHGLKCETIIQRLVHSDIGSQISDFFARSNDDLREPSKNNEKLAGFLADWFGYDSCTQSNIHRSKNIEQDIFVSQKMMYHIKEFLFYSGKSSSKTRKKAPSCKKQYYYYWKEFRKTRKRGQRR